MNRDRITVGGCHREGHLHPVPAQAIRQAASEPGFLAGVLNFVLAHEPTLMRFSEETGIEPARVADAIRHLPLGDDGYQTST